MASPTMTSTVELTVGDTTREPEPSLFMALAHYAWFEMVCAVEVARHAWR